MNLIFTLFYTFFNIGLFSFGGGYAMLPLIRQEVVLNHLWVSSGEFTDIVAISQATPGPIAINAATYIGYKVGGVLGSTMATLGVVLPSFIIMLIMSKFFMKFKDNKYMDYAFLGIRPVTVGLVAAAAIVVAPNAFIDFKSILIFAGAFIASYKYKADPIILTIIAGVLGYLIY